MLYTSPHSSDNPEHFENLTLSGSFPPKSVKTHLVNASVNNNDTSDLWISFNNFSVPTFLITWYCIIFFLGIVGNGLVIWIAGFKMKTISSVWLLNLAIADLISCASIPLRIAEWITIKQMKLLLCKISTGLFFVTMTSSVNFLTAMSVDRCISVIWPIWWKHHRTYRSAATITVIIWALSLIMSFPFVTVNNLFFSFTECSTKKLEEKTKKFMQIARFIVMFFIPFIIILICNGIMCFKLRKVKKKGKTFRSYKIFVALVMIFFITAFPYHAWRLIPLNFSSEAVDHFLTQFFVCLAYLNSGLNPFLYVFMGTDFKKHFRLALSEVKSSFSEKPSKTT
ncbi:C3a anaphylatoxin chemotactic receptor-like [Rhinoderma darwinii]|uniref:C3a anaphylatoxin chemotactic receptor-like n=1 Tax=Rhinoderma darwinii TaxID=43563 RepID=UPI003F665650